MRLEVLGEQILRLAREAARQCKVREDEVEDCAGVFLLKFKDEDLHGSAWQEEKLNKLKAMALTYMHGQHTRLTRRAKREVSLTGADGTEASGPAAHLVSREPGPEERTLREMIWDHVYAALRWLNPSQRDLFRRDFEEEERTLDIQEAQGRSADAIYMARARLRLRLRRLLIAAGLDHDTVSDILSELERLQSQR